MDTQTLDTKLRERARKKLETAVWAVTGDFLKALDAVGPVTNAQRAKDLRTGLRKKDSPDSLIDIEAACRFLAAEVIEAATPAWRQREVDAFIADLENLKVSVEELAARTE
jgi:hypothetical protein